VFLDAAQPSGTVKKKKVSVGDWNEAAQWVLLNELVPFRRELRTQRYASNIWESVSQKLKQYQLPEDYTSEQIAEKVRLMKRSMKDVHSGKRKTKWDFIEMMEFIFKKAIEDTEEGEVMNLEYCFAVCNFLVTGCPS